MKKIIYSLAVITLFIGGASHADNCGSSPTKSTETVESTLKSGNTPDIVVTAVESGKFSMLVAAIKAAGLVGTLKSEGPFTVFAPADEAFAELPEGVWETLLADPEKLKSLLTYHVVDGVVTSDRVMKMEETETLNGKSIAVISKDGQIMINDANVIAADIMCKNGVIHVLDKVIVPNEESR
jgi:uncharacterized surface protein with fasciclin (FAS1) repeats